MNELQLVYEHVVEVHLAGAGLVLDVSNTSFSKQEKLNSSGLNLHKSGSVGLKSGNYSRSNAEGRNRYNDSSDGPKSDFDDSYDASFTV